MRLIEPGGDFRVGEGTTHAVENWCMKVLSFEARSDAGLKRSKNDDSGYGGRSLLSLLTAWAAT